MEFIFAIDLDGTLLNDKAQLTKKTISYIKKLDKEKYKIIITTGRPYQGMLSYYEELGLDSLAICNSGTSVVCPNTAFKSIEHPLEKEMFIGFFKKTKPYIDSGIYNVLHKCFIYNKRNDNEFLKHVARNSYIIEGPFDETYEESPNGVLLIIKAGKEKIFEEAVKEFDELSCRSWGNFYGNDFYEVYQKKYNKATSLDEVLKHYNVSSNQLVCIGDSINDMEMLEKTDYSVAMKNANKEVKKIAHYITKYDNNNNGVIRFIKQFIKDKKRLK